MYVRDNITFGKEKRLLDITEQAVGQFALQIH